MAGRIRVNLDDIPALRGTIFTGMATYSPNAWDYAFKIPGIEYEPQVKTDDGYNFIGRNSVIDKVNVVREIENYLYKLNHGK